MNIGPETKRDLLYTNLRMGFEKGYSVAETWSDGVATTMPSSTREEQYAWLRMIPRLRQWVGERLFNNLVAAKYSLENLRWEDSIEVDIDDVNDDRLGIYSMSAEMLGRASKKWPDDVMKTVLQNGVSALAFDGVPFFSTSHPTGAPAGGVYSNLFAGTALSSAAVNTVRAAMRSYVDESGKSMDVNPRLLVVPPQLQVTAEQIANATFTAPVVAVGQNAGSVQQSNVLQGAFKIKVVNELSNEPTVWYMADDSKGIMPLLWQLREAPQLTPVTDPQSYPVFLQNKYLYGVKARGNGGYTLPFLMARAAE